MESVIRVPYVMAGYLEDMSALLFAKMAHRMCCLAYRSDQRLYQTYSLWVRGIHEESASPASLIPLTGSCIHSSPSVTVRRVRRGVGDHVYTGLIDYVSSVISDRQRAQYFVILANRRVWYCSKPCHWPVIWLSLVSPVSDTVLVYSSRRWCRPHNREE